MSLCCYTWLPHYAGTVDKDNTPHDVFNSIKVEKIRESIHDGSFKYCDCKLCPHIQNGTLPDKKDIKGPRMKKIVENRTISNLKPDFYNLCYDESCNLKCPSCRSDNISHIKGEEYEQRLQIQKQIIKEIFDEPHNRNCTVNITGSGDPFGSKLFRELLFSIDGKKFPRVSINLQTNGVMFTPKYWDKMEKIHDNINAVIVSYDAATQHTYDQIRKGGDWDILQKNMTFLSTLRQQNLINELRIDCVVQTRNYEEMPELVELGKKLKVDTVYFSRIVDWNTWNIYRFNREAVWREEHPQYKSFQQVLMDPILKDDIVDLGNLTEFVL